MRLVERGRVYSVFETSGGLKGGNFDAGASSLAFCTWFVCIFITSVLKLLFMNALIITLKRS